MMTKVSKPVSVTAISKARMGSAPSGGASSISGRNKRGISMLSGYTADSVSRNCFHGFGGFVPSGVNQKSNPVRISV